ncbi:MAG: AraC family transcriptional regulator [Eubacteriales bacterium]|nr:AraC family transcriptional regulator [Eubacteriales bacterium]
MNELSAFEMLETAIKDIQSHFDTSWLFIDAPWNTRSYDLIESIPAARKNAPYSELQRHSHWEMSVLLSGENALRVDEKVFPLHKREVAIIPPGTLHQDLPYADKESLTLWIVLEPGNVSLHFAGIDLSGAFFAVGHVWPDFDISYSNHHLQAIQNELYSGVDSWSELIVKAEVLAMLVMTLKYMMPDNLIPNYCNWQEKLVGMITKHIENSNGEKLVLGDIAQHFGLSVNYMSTIFKTKTGKTIATYAQEHRIYVAKEMLYNTAFSIKEIANTLGYYDQYHFSKGFKKSVGVSPKAFREKGRFI